MLELQANLIHKPVTMAAPVCKIRNIIELAQDEFIALKHRPNANYSFITENHALMSGRNGVFDCLLVLDEGGRDGILIEAEGYDYVRCGAFMPRARDFVEMEMERAAAILLKKAPLDQEYNDIYISYSEIAEQTGAAEIRIGSEIVRMFCAAIARHPGIADVEASSDCLVITPSPKQIPGVPGGLKVRDILLLGGMDNVYMVHETADAGFVSLGHFEMLGETGRTEHAGVLNAGVREIRSGACGTEIVLSGVEPQALANLDRAAAEYMKAGGMKGPGM